MNAYNVTFIKVQKQSKYRFPGVRHTIYLATHSDSISGHYSGSKTLEKIRMRYFWVQMATSVKEWAKGCIVCQQMKTPPIPKVPIKSFTNFQRPFQFISMDVVGPFKRTERGNLYVLAWTCHLTKFCEATAIGDLSAHTIAKAFIEHVCLRWDFPQVLLSDQMKGFTSKFIAETCKLLRINKIFSASWSPWTNGQIERSQSLIIKVMSKFANKDNWDLFLPAAVYAVRTTPNASSRYTPYYLVFGRESHLPIDIIYDQQIAPYSPEDLTEDMVDYAKKQVAIWRHAKENVTQAQLEMQDKFNQKAKLSNIRVGDFVWVIDRTTTVGEPSKFHIKYKGPYRVAKMNMSTCFVVPYNAPGKSLLQVHLNNIKPYKSPHIPLQNLLPAPRQFPKVETAENKQPQAQPEPADGIRLRSRIVPRPLVP